MVIFVANTDVAKYIRVEWRQRKTLKEKLAFLKVCVPWWMKTGGRCRLSMA